MSQKNKIRIIFFKLRKKKYFEVSKEYFEPLINLINNFTKKKHINLSLYYPSNYEINTINLFKIFKSNKNISTFLPIIKGRGIMKFYNWSHHDLLKVNKFGLLEPFELKKSIIPDIMLIPLLVFDDHNQRLGYGKGYYDKFLNKYLKLNKNILTIGVAFSFQKYSKLPISKYDVKLDHILTENGIK